MRKLFKASLFFITVLAFAWMLKAVAPGSAGDMIISNNRGAENEVFFVNDEPSLVINGFDLTPYTPQLPIALDAVSISVARAAPGINIDLVVYQDANGGSPIDSTLVHRQSVQINSAGVQRIVLNEAAIITEPVAWVGFYLPVGFRFHADASGPSVLTYWAWAPGSAFDISSLANAPVLGPGDGSEPVGIDMQGVARINVELRPLFHQEMGSATLLGSQLVAESEQDTALMQGYPYCGDLFHDAEDIAITSRASFTIHCGVAAEFEAPTILEHTDERLLDVQRAGHLYKIEAQIPQDQRVEGAVNTLPVPVTHCLRIAPGDLERAVIAEARGIPETWHVLPSVRFEDLVCAEVTTASYLSYFLPRGEGAPPNVNLVIGWSQVDPHPLECGLPAFIEAPAINTGQSWFSTQSGYVKFIVENIHVRSGTITGAIELSIETSQLGPGMRHLLRFGPLYVTTYVNELHRLQVRADFDNQIEETNENDNVWFTEYILSNAQESERCFDIPWLTATPTSPYLVEGICFVDIPRRDSAGKVVIRYSPACQIDEFGRGSMEDRATDWTHTLRGCEIRVRTQVEGQRVSVRWTNRGGCQPGGLDHYRQVIELRGEDVHQLVIDHDLPTPTPTATPRNRALRAPNRLRYVYNDVSKMLKFEWDPVDGADEFVFQYRLADQAAADHVWLTPPVMPDHEDEELTFPVDATNVGDTSLAIERGTNYVWKVWAVDSSNDDGNVAVGDAFSVPRLAEPKDLEVANIPFVGVESSDNFMFSWKVVKEGGTPIAEYEFQYRDRELGPTWTPQPVVTDTNVDTVNVIEYILEIDPKDKSYQWRVQAKNGGDWANDDFHFSSRDLTREANAAIAETATRIPTPENTNADRTTDPSKIVFIWNSVTDATRYDLQYRIIPSSSRRWDSADPQPSTPSYEHPLSLTNRNDFYEWRVRAVVGLAVGRWGPEATVEP